jgi:hypothetical protein
MNRRGTSILEMMTVAVLGVLVIFAMVAATSVTSRSQQKVSSGTDVSMRARQSLDVVMRDVMQAYEVVSAYPIAGPTSFSSNDTNTLILKLPKLSSGEVVPYEWELVMYRLEPITGDQGPMLLKRSVAAYNENWSTSEKSINKFGTAKTVAVNITDFDLAYIAHERLAHTDTDPNKILKRFTLRTASQGHRDIVKQQAFLEGDDMIAAGTATFSGNTINVASSLPAYKIIDAYYVIDPSDVIGGDGKSNANEIAVRFKLKPRWKNEGNVDKTRQILVQSRATLRNQ